MFPLYSALQYVTRHSKTLGEAVSGTSFALAHFLSRSKTIYLPDSGRGPLDELKQSIEHLNFIAVKRRHRCSEGNRIRKASLTLSSWRF